MAPKFNPNADYSAAQFDPSAEYSAADSGASSAPAPPGELRKLTQRERFEMTYPVGVKGEGVGENVKNIANNVGVGMWQTIAHPIKTAESMAASITPGLTELNAYRKAHGLPVSAEDEQFAATPNPIKGAYQMLTGGHAGEQIPQAVGSAIVMGRVVPSIEGALDLAPRAARGAADAVAGTGPRVTKALVAKTVADNAADATEAAKENKLSADKYQTDAALAKHENTGRELAHIQDLKAEAEKIRNKDAGDAAKLKADHEKALSDAREHNARVAAKHKEAVARVQGENAAGENTLQMRQQAEQTAQDDAREYYKKENAVAAKSKAAENSAWSKWRGKMKGATMDGGIIEGQLKKLSQTSPEVERVLHQLTPRGDEVDPGSSYALARKGIAADYDTMSPDDQARVDTELDAAGFSPDTIEFDPQEGKPISVDQVQRTNSIIQRYIRSNQFEGPLLGEMKQVSKVLRNAVSQASEAHGALGDLDAARVESIRHNQAFGRERPEPRTVKGERERWANPEEKKAVQEEERIEAAAKTDPTLADAARKARASRDALKKFPSEDQLRKTQKQVPRPPSEGDLREGYRLKPEPTAPAPRLTSGSAEERAAQTVRQPERVPRPPQPPVRLAAPRKVGAEDVQAAKAEAVANRADTFRNRGGGLASTFLVLDGIRNAFHGNVAAIGEDIGARAAFGVAKQSAARLLENPKVANWLSQATPRDVAQIPADLRGDFPALVKAAQAKGIKVSPALLGIAAVSGMPAPRAKHPTDVFQDMKP